MRPNNEEDLATLVLPPEQMSPLVLQCNSSCIGSPSPQTQLLHLPPQSLLVCIKQSNRMEGKIKAVASSTRELAKANSEGSELTSSTLGLTIVGTPSFHAERQNDRRDIDRTVVYEPTHRWWEPPLRAWIYDLNHEILIGLILWNTAIVLLGWYTDFCGESDPGRTGGFCDDDWTMADGAVYNTLGVGMFLLLSFRAHEGYGRFWEGRKAWGRVRECCRELTRQICFHIRVDPGNEEGKEERRRAVGFVGAFASTLKLTLRRERNPVPELGEILIFQDILNIERQSTNSSMPQFCLDVLSYYLQRNLEAGNLGEHTLAAMTSTCLTPLADAMGTTERIRNQPVPLSYALHLRFFMILWLGLYPIYLVGVYGWYAVLLASLVDYAVLGIESMACEIENPFGYHKNCIDLCGYCKGIVADTQSILARVEHADSHFVFDGKKVRTLNQQLFQTASDEERKELDTMLGMREVTRKECIGGFLKLRR